MLSQHKFFGNILLGLRRTVVPKKPCRPDVRLEYKKERPGMDAGTCAQIVDRWIISLLLPLQFFDGSFLPRFFSCAFSC